MDKSDDNTVKQALHENSKELFDHIIVHYDEIGLKGDNRGTFESLLMNNIKAKAGKLVESIIRESGQLTIAVAKGADLDKLSSILSKIPGIALFSPARKLSLKFEEVEKEFLHLLKGIEFETFKIDAKRHDKAYPMNSIGLNNKLGELVVKNLGKKAKMQSPDITIKVEVNNKGIYASFKTTYGVGGMPTDQNQKVVALLSGGFDSPVASYMMMKRGCQVILVHFKNENQMSCAVEGKIRELAEQLSGFQRKTVLYIINFGDIQREIIMKAHSEMRMLIYRRFMLRIASKIAGKNSASFLVVGDSLSQVASQTLTNLEATYKDVGMHIFTPLIGMNKKEIIALSRQIGTYDISAQPYGDCCSFFLPKHPELKGNNQVLKKIELEFDLDKLADEAIKNSEIIKFD